MTISEEDRETVGAAAHRLLLKKDTKQGIVDTQREVDKTYFEECWKCITREPHKNWKDPWYLTVLYKKERLLENIIRRYFFGRQSLPTPEYDQTVWRYNPVTTDLNYLWTIPDKNTTLWMYSNPKDIPFDQQYLKQFVFDFIDGKLYSSFQDKYMM